ncbi:CreA family protein [Shewanella litorisediminis]|uniref:CreA family protein n=1 Tax=Shewanella litorisediminis TaxID=1173586 RepID=A0ABX7FZ25_9GAMM|nr:CreA family protein [Shewanella litorisediminis]MCL2918733.1 CreA family protein [Shewanella litorisediminis]QRH00296.1 CreA family protein [Shewanella litorisediminis]
MNISWMKSTLLLGVATLGLAGCGDDVGKVSLGLFTTKDVVIDARQDPKVPGVTCHISRVEADLSLADPSDMSISCRQTGPILASQIAAIDKSKNGEVVFSSSLSVLFKTLKVRRIYDAGSQTLMYLSYSTKETSGSHKHSLSTVPLYGTQAWQSGAMNSPSPGN